MTQTAWTAVIIGVTFALYLGVAVWSRVRSTAGFYVAGRGVSPIANGMATGADWMSAASFLSMAGLISFLGYTGGIYLMGWTGGYVLLALLLAPYLRRYGKFTVPEFVGDRYASQGARVVAVLCALFISFTYVAGQMQGVGIAFARFLEVERSTGVVLGAGIVLFYASLGGMRGITYTQVAQYCVLILAYVIPAVAISLQLTGEAVPQVGLVGTVESGPSAGVALLELIDDLHRELGLPEYTAAFEKGKKSMVDVACITLALMVGTAGLPHVLVRFYTVECGRAARWSAFWALLFIAILYTTAPAVAVFARVNLIQTVQGKPHDDAPAWFAKWESTGLIEFDDKNGDGIMQGIARSGDTGPAEVLVNPDILVLANPEIANLPPWIVALVVAGGLAAALSTAAGLLLVISASVSHDLIKSVWKPDLSDRQELLAARLAACGAVVVAAWFGIHPPGFVAQVVAFAFGLAASSFFPVLVLGVFHRRVNKQGAIAGMVAGIGFTSAYIIGMKATGAGPDVWWWGISPEGIGAVGMVLNFVVTLGVTYVTPPPPREVQELVSAIRRPDA